MVDFHNIVREEMPGITAVRHAEDVRQLYNYACQLEAEVSRLQQVETEYNAYMSAEWDKSRRMSAELLVNLLDPDSGINKATNAMDLQNIVGEDVIENLAADKLKQPTE